MDDDAQTHASADLGRGRPGGLAPHPRRHLHTGADTPAHRGDGGGVAHRFGGRRRRAGTLDRRHPRGPRRAAAAVRRRRRGHRARHSAGAQAVGGAGGAGAAHDAGRRLFRRSRSPSTRSTSRRCGRSGRRSPATSTNRGRSAGGADRPVGPRARDLVPADGCAAAAAQPHPRRRRRAARRGRRHGSGPRSRPAAPCSTTSEAPAFWVLADPEGNEACICTWQGRD